MPATGALIGTPPSISDSDEAQTEPIEVEPLERQHLGHEAQRVGPLLEGRDHRQQGPLGQQAVADLAALGAAHATRLAVGVGRHVVVVHVALLGLVAQGVEQLVHLRHAEGEDVEHLGLATLEQAGAVGGAEHADLGGDRAQVGGATAVDADALVDRAGADADLLGKLRAASLTSLVRPANGRPRRSLRRWPSALAASLAALRSALSAMVPAWPRASPAMASTRAVDVVAGSRGRASNSSGVDAAPAFGSTSSFWRSIDSLIQTLQASSPPAMTSSVTFGAPAS